MIQTILSLLSAAVTIYTIMCFINILLSWIPGLKFTKFGHFISRVCDPYMNLFSKHGWFRVGSIDFSPILSIGVLTVISSILAGIQGTGRIYFGGILATILGMMWNMCSSLMALFLILLFIRWLVLIINKGQTSYDSPWNQIDPLLRNISQKVCGTFLKKSTSFTTSLLITWISFAVILLLGSILINNLVHLCNKLPF